MNKQQMILEDGRKAEKVVHVDNDKTITELYVEPAIEKKLNQRVVEYSKPIVHKREIETIDDSGAVVEKRIESIEPEVKPQLREVIQTESSIKAQSIAEPCDCFVTQEDMQATFREGFLAVARALGTAPAEDEPKVSAMQAVVAERVEQATDVKNDTTFYFLLCSAAGLGAIFFWLVFIM